MAPSWTEALLLNRDDGTSPPAVYKEPLAGVITSVILAMGSIGLLSCFITLRVGAIKSWSSLPYVQWLVFIIYIDSLLFVFATGILQFGLGVNLSLSVCESAILICLIFYVTTKLIYLFLVEKAHIIRANSKKGRFKSKLYLFNSFGMMGMYMIVVVLNFVFRITRMEDGQCIIGMQRLAMIPLIVFDLLVNVYLTFLFLIPLSSLYTFKNFQKTPANVRLRTVAFRTFVGSCCTLASSIINLSVLMALNGEPGWVCLMCCNCDVLFTSVVLQWVTSPDSQSGDTSVSASRHHHTANEELGEMSRKRAYDTEDQRQQTSDGTIQHPNRDRRRSDTSNESSHVASSTKAIVDDVADIARDSATRDGPELSPTSGKTLFYEGEGRGISTAVHEVDPDGHSFGRAVAPEVHVHVDYRVTQNAANPGDPGIGNTVTIESGPGDEPARRMRGVGRGI
ncbi:hypothetical protein GQ53DRAFT_843620 [Thozetella sp. PMI_491]|nr:hypothetical protein GQ53DRAFT_843620 [Thozetella sp. PMI_491]